MAAVQMAMGTTSLLVSVVLGVSGYTVAAGVPRRVSIRAVLAAAAGFGAALLYAVITKGPAPVAGGAVVGFLPLVLVAVLHGALQAIPKIDVYPTGANFVLIKIKNGSTAPELQARLLEEHQMYVRDCSNKVGMDRFHIRVASQGREKDARLVAALRELIA